MMEIKINYSIRPYEMINMLKNENKKPDHKT